MTKTIATLENINQKNRDLVSVEWLDGTASIIHVIRMPDHSEKGFYIAAISSLYYITREHRNFSENYRKGIAIPRRFHIHYTHQGFMCDIHRNEKYFKEHYPHINYVDQYRNLPIYEHDSLWDYYKFINYDYKKKKYI